MPTRIDCNRHAFIRQADPSGDRGYFKVVRSGGAECYRWHFIPQQRASDAPLASNPGDSLPAHLIVEPLILEQTITRVDSFGFEIIHDLILR